MKHCPRCGENKLLTTEFWYRNSHANDGYQGYCKLCKSNIHKNYMKDLDVGKRVRRKVREWQKGVGKEKYFVARVKYEKSKKRRAWRQERTKKAIEFAKTYINRLIKEENKTCKT